MFDFNIKENYTKDIQDIVDKIEKEIGIQVVKVKTWKLLLNEYSIGIETKKLKQLNIIEEFIIKIALSDLKKNITSSQIKSILGLDEIFINKSLNKLCNSGIIDEKLLPTIAVTDKGKKQYENGKVAVPEKIENIGVFAHPKFNLFYSSIVEESLQYPTLELDNYEKLSLKHIQDNPDILDEIIDIVKENKVALTKDSFSQSMSKIISIEDKGKKLSANYIEIWIYDIIDGKLYCRVWDCQCKKYRKELSEYITKTNQLSISDFETQQVDKIEDTSLMIYTKYEEEFIEEVKEKRKNKDISETTLRMVRGADIKKEFESCLKSANHYLYIQSPWISKNVVDKNMINTFKDLVNKGCKIFISWGISRNIEKEDRKPEDSLLEEIKSIKTKSGLPGVFIYWIGNHHDKEIIVDNKSHLVGSFNWLSYRGDYLPRGESVYITGKTEAIQEAKEYWEEQIFNKICEDIFNDDYIMNINALISLSTKKECVENILIEEIKSLFGSNKEIKDINKLYNLALIHFKNEVFNDTFVKSLSILISNNKFLKECYMMINYIRINKNSEIYEVIMSNYKNNFVEFRIINEKDVCIYESSDIGNISRLVIV